MDPKRKNRKQKEKNNMNIELAKEFGDICIKEGLTQEGAAGWIGNLVYESDGFVPDRVEYLLIQRYRERGKVYTKETYTAAVDSGAISKEEFLNPWGNQYGYGLAQWTSRSRKEKLYEFAKSNLVSIGNAKMQFMFAINEMKEKFPAIWNLLCTTHSIKEASDVVLKKYEMPADVSERMCQERCALAVEYYEKAVQHTASELVNVMRSWVGLNEGDGSHMKIINIYNDYKPLARGYAVQRYDAWCATTVSAALIKIGMASIIKPECGCEEFINRNKDYWVEDDSVTPEPGWIILYDWEDSGAGDCKGWADHIGVVEEVKDGKITVIEGNCDNMVKRRTLAVNGRYIRGYVVPPFKKANEVQSKPEKTEKPVAESKPVQQVKMLQKGSTGEAVKELQEKLITCEYSCGDAGADGVFGKDTEKAVKKFQKDYKLEVDGIAGPITQTALDQLYNGTVYRIVEGSYLYKENADNQGKKMIADGFSEAKVIKENEYWVLEVLKTRNQKKAKKTLDECHKKGYSQAAIL